jgi:hypothetical protein
MSEWLPKREGKAYLVVQRVNNVPHLESKYKPEGVGYLCETTAPDGLLAEHADIDEPPEDHARSELIERLEIKGADGRVQFASDEELGRER